MWISCSRRLEVASENPVPIVPVFQLADEEWAALRSQFVTLKKQIEPASLVLSYPDTAISVLEIIKGVVIHKRNARSRKTVKFYVEQAGQ